jgi:uncharacterized protein (TIGR03086 family)
MLMSKIIHIPNGTEEITAVTLTTILREKGVIGTETAVARGFASAARGETQDRSVWTDRAFGDLRSEYAESAQRVVAAFGEPDVLEREFWLPLLTETRLFPGPQAVSFHLLDYVVHGWDVAASLRQPIDLPADVIALVREIADREVPNGPRRHRPGSSFQPAVDWQESDSTLDGLLAMLGRSPTWPN